MYKLVILDYDGTMIGRSGVVTDRVKNSIRLCVQKGVKVSVSTGRSPYSLKNLIKELHLDVPHVFMAGAFVYNPIKDLCLVEEPIKAVTVYKTADFASQHNLYLEAGTKDKLFYNLEESIYVQKRKQITGEADGLVDIKRLAEKEKILIMRFMVENGKEKNLINELRKQLQENLNFYSAFPFNFPQTEVVNMTDRAVSKVSALRHLCQYLNISPEETMAIGDSEVDLPLIENVGMGIAMGNAGKNIKARAKWVTDDVEHDGVAKTLEKFITFSG